MPRIFDNLTQSTKLLPALRETLALSSRADFCVGYINLRGWGGVGPLVDAWQPGQGPCRILVGMHKVPEDELREHFAGRTQALFGIDNKAALCLRRKLARELREQLTFGAPTNEDEAALRRLVRQLRAGKVKVKLFLRHTHHAKLYLLYRDDPVNPVTAFLGSSNLKISIIGSIVTASLSKGSAETEANTGCQRAVEVPAWWRSVSSVPRGAPVPTIRHWLLAAPEVVVGIEARGLIIGVPVAQALGGGLRLRAEGGEAARGG